jgi:nucleosome assembly protein 1-like 1
MSNDIPYDYEDQFKEALEKITDQNLKKKLVAIKKLVVKRLNLENEFKRENNKLEYEYEQKYKPLYEQRRKIVSGEEKPKKEEILNKLNLVGLKEEDLDKEEKEKGIPDFWLKCIENAHDIKDLNEKDKKILKHLKDVKSEIQENGDFKLIFVFEPNDYFSQTELVKEYKLDEEFEIKTVTSTQIDWKDDDKNPTIEIKKKKLKNKKNGQIKIVNKKTEVPSFFSGFKNFEKKDKKKIEQNEDEEEAEEDEFDIEDEYDFGTLFKDEIIPFAIEYYLNVVEDDNDEEEDEDFEEEDDDK